VKYIVKTGGRVIPPRIDQIGEDVPKKRAIIAEILRSTWRACTEADPERPDVPAADLIPRQSTELRPHPLRRSLADSPCI
jgi:hypothetical protein